MEDKQLQAAVTANHEHRELTLAAKARSPKEAAELLAEYPVTVIATVLQELAPAQTQDVLGELPGGLVDGVMHAVSGEIAAQWQTNSRFPEGSIGRMMVPPRAVFRPDMSVRDTIEQLRPLGAFWESLNPANRWTPISVASLSRTLSLVRCR